MTTANKFRAEKMNGDHHKKVAVFTVLGDTVRCYTYATWTDYTNDETLPIAEARAAWSRLMADGWVKAAA